MMTISSKLYFEFKKEYIELTATDVAEFMATKDFETEKSNFINGIVVEEVMKNGIVDYICLKHNNAIINNFRGIDVDTMKEESAFNTLFAQYKNELADFVFNKLQML